MISFDVSLLFELPVERDKNGIWHLSTKSLPDFWKQNYLDELKLRNGCYILGVSTKTIKPWYIGKTWRGFGNEIFMPYQQTRISKFINEHGTPVVVFVYKKYKLVESQHTKKVIRTVENFLIQTAVSINPDLLNVHGTNSDWCIKGVIRSRTTGPIAGEI
jgi:hypothetical protein